MLTESLITCSSMVRPPQLLIATDWPPIGLPEPGLTTTVMTPPESVPRPMVSPRTGTTRALMMAVTVDVRAVVMLLPET